MEKVIVQNGDPVLRKKAREVLLAEISSAKIAKVLSAMQEALLSQDDGVALAAPQIGVSLRIFIVSKAALALPENLKERAQVAERRDLKRQEGFLTFINPVIIKRSREKALLDEGCLSVRPLYGQIKRSTKVSLTAFDEDGKKVSRGTSGLLAQVFQHECDHLDGILFIDHAVNIREVEGTTEPSQ